MVKKLELTRHEAQQRILLFLKLRKGKQISDATISDFNKLLDKMWDNFKGYQQLVTSPYQEKKNEIIYLAFKTIKCGFIQWENGGNCKITDIDNFSLYTNDTYKVSIKGELKEISERDYKILKYVVFGEC